MEPRYRDSRVARNSALSTRYLAAFAAICLVSTIVLSIGALMLSTFSDDQIARAICICLDVCFLHISLAITGVIVDMLQLFPQLWDIALEEFEVRTGTTDHGLTPATKETVQLLVDPVWRARHIEKKPLKHI